MGHVIEDYLDAIGVSLDGFVERMSGGWLFGYVEALEVAGVRALLVIVPLLSGDRSGGCMGRPGDDMAPAGAQVLPQAAPVQCRPYAFDWRAALSARQGPGGWWVTGVGCEPLASTPMRSLRAVLRAEACGVLVCQEYEEARFDLCVAFRRLLGVRVFATFQAGRTPAASSDQ